MTHYIQSINFLFIFLSLPLPFLDLSITHILSQLSVCLNMYVYVVYLKAMMNAIKLMKMPFHDQLWGYSITF